MLEVIWVVIVSGGGGVAAYAAYPHAPELFTPVVLRWLSTVFALVWGGILLVLTRLGDLPAEQALSIDEMRRVRPVVRRGVRKLWVIAALNLACAIAVFVIGELRHQALSREMAVALGMFLGVGIFYFIQVIGWLSEIREFRWKLAERESARKSKQEALRELGGKYESDPRFDKPVI